MFRAARHAVELMGFAATKRARLEDDEQALSELQTEELGLPAELGIEWLGVSGYRLTFEGQTLYVDPYFSRVPLRSLLLRRPATPDPAALQRFLPSEERVVGVLVGHTHFDHAVDAPAIARRYGCRAYGSSSLVSLMGLHGIAEQGVQAEPYRTYELGPFEVTFVPSAHSKLLLGLAVPYAGELTCDHLDGLAPSAYRCGQVWGIHIAVGGITLYHQGSANLIDDAVRHRGVDVFLAGIAGRNFTERYWDRILPRLDPAVVVPTHYDDFFVPLAAEMDLMGNARIAQLPEELHAVSRDVRVVALPRFEGAPQMRGGSDRSHPFGE
jgi:L-ascorbate metabolism protein UlaG (beta-lactamase superfamily)